jgi:outer membrane receptor protein involved in Fe transport
MLASSSAPAILFVGRQSYFSIPALGNYFNDLLNGKAGRTSSCGSQNGQNPTATGSQTGWTGTDQCYNSFVQGFGNPVFGIQTTDWSAFVQDNWKATPRLTLELGARYDYEFLPAPVSSLTSATTGFTPYAQLKIIRATRTILARASALRTTRLETGRR